MSLKKWLILAAVLVVIAGSILFITKKTAEAPASSTQSDNTTQSEETEPTSTDQSDVITAAEVAKHNNKSDCWTIISGNVYDVTDFVSRHPGGDEILRACGVDATLMFTQRETADGEQIGSGTPHSSAAASQLAQFKIGTLAQ